MSTNSFENLIVWQKAECLVILIYKTFERLKDYSFKDQICRASISVMNNIAEGFERKGDREFRHFLYIAKGSCGEVRSMLYAASGLGYIKENTLIEIKELSIEISKILSSLISKME